jgi:hypothetical protein
MPPFDAGINGPRGTMRAITDGVTARDDVRLLIGRWPARIGDA